jgi:hypothetical protein
VLLGQVPLRVLFGQCARVACTVGRYCYGQ